MSIVPLPPRVSAQINSSSSLTCLREVILELFKNSLDANCTKVEINVDYSKGICVVEDNGIGILPSEFCESGGLAKPYHTSKQYDTGTVHGSRGNSLSSISAIALLTITSHHCSYQSHNTLCINHSIVLFRQLPALPQHHIHFDHGTRVTVHNLFGNMPVRVKQRAINSAKQGGNMKEWNELILGLIRLLFPWTKTNVSITIRDRRTNNKIFLQTPLYKPTKDFIISKICSILRQASIMVDDESSWVPVQASAEGLMVVGAISLRPHASRRCQFLSFGIKPISPLDNSLYDDINKLFSASNFGNVEIAADIEDEEIKRRGNDKRFKRAGYTLRELKCVKGIEKWPKFYLKVLSENAFEKSISVCKDRDSLQEPRGFSVKAKELLEELIWEFLKDNSFCSKQVYQKRINKGNLSKFPVTKSIRQSKTLDSMLKCPLSFTSSTTRLRSIIHNQFGSDVKLPCFRQNNQSSGLSLDIFSKIKVGATTRASTHAMPMLNTASKSTEDISAKRSLSVPLEDTKDLESRVRGNNTITVKNNKPLSMPEKLTTCNFYKDKAIENDSLNYTCRDMTFPHEITSTHLQNFETHKSITRKETISLWSNPVTQKKYKVSPGTGFVIAPLSLQLESPTQGFIRQTISTKIAPNDPNSWIGQLFRSWNNPVYLPAEKGIPQVSLESHDLRKQRFSAGQLQSDMKLGFNEVTTELNSRISKRSLKSAEFISQVDNKFIFVKISTKYINESTNKSDELLVMIDQHAADERIRIESLLEDLCTPLKAKGLDSSCQVKSHILIKPLSICLPSNEIELLSTYKDHFLSWGFFYELPVQEPISPQKSITQTLTVLAMPQVITERCQQHPHLLISLLRKEIWKLQDLNENPLQILSTSNSWIDRIHACPIGLLDLLNTRACRSAIMFNDELSDKKCQTLVKRLAECSFPFQCAHGRPSMVPLVNISALGFDQNDSWMWNGQDFSPRISLGVQFKRWKRQ